MAGKREHARRETTAAILAAARAEIAANGGVGLSMRAVAREVGLVSSAVYRYFPTREALLTAMIIDSYRHLDRALGEAIAPASRVDSESRAECWRLAAAAFRDWARANANEFQLIYGTPIPDYAAPPETIPAALGVAAHFLRVGAERAVTGFEQAELAEQMTTLADDVSGIDQSGAAAVLAELAALVGLVGLELSGHLAGTADPAGPLFDALVERQIVTLGLT